MCSERDRVPGLPVRYGRVQRGRVGGRPVLLVQWKVKTTPPDLGTGDVVF